MRVRETHWVKPKFKKLVRIFCLKIAFPIKVTRHGCLSDSKQKTETTKEVLWKMKKKKRKSLESVSKVVMVFLYIKTWLKIGVDHLHNEENAL